MDRQTVLSSDWATLWYYPQTKIIHHEFHKFVFGKALRDVVNGGVDLMKRHHARKYLSDDRKNGALKGEDAEWAKTEWFPVALKAGWTHWAVLLPESVTGKLKLERFVGDFANMGLTVEVFSDPARGLAWLESQ